MRKAGNFPLNKIQLILFLSKSLITAKHNYWPIKLKMAALVWTVRKTHHLIKATPKTYILTDYLAITALAKKHNLTTTTLTKNLNIQLVLVSQYLQ